MTKAFVDTNVAVYANDHREPAKRAQATHLLQQLGDEGRIVVSAQVLHEYASVALTKLRQAPDAVARQVRLLAAAEVVPLTPDLIGQSIALSARYQISYWDACILAAAETAGCEVLYSEDLNAGQAYSGVRVVNPCGLSPQADPTSPRQ